MDLARQIVKPIARRLATSVGAALTTYGMAETDAAAVVAVIPLVLGFAIDVLISNFAAARGWK